MLSKHFDSNKQAFEMVSSRHFETFHRWSRCSSTPSNCNAPTTIPVKSFTKSSETVLTRSKHCRNPAFHNYPRSNSSPDSSYRCGRRSLRRITVDIGKRWIHWRGFHEWTGDCLVHVDVGCDIALKLPEMTPSVLMNVHALRFTLRSRLSVALDIGSFDDGGLIFCRYALTVFERCLMWDSAVIGGEL